MRDLRDFGKDLSNLTEGILDDMDDVLDAGDDAVTKMEIEKWFVNKQCKVWKTRQGYVLHGDFKIKEASSPYNGPKIKNIKGSLAIQGTDLETLEGMFCTDCNITGTFTLEDNNKLTSLKGCPLSCGTLVLSGNKKLTDIDIAPMVHLNAYVSGNGRKFKKDYIMQKVQVYKHIFCAVDTEEALINEAYLTEAFKAPQLKQVAIAIKKAQSKVDYWGNKEKPFNLGAWKEVQWDKISASQITEYDIEDKRCMTTVRAYLSGKIRGVMAIMDDKGEVDRLIKGKSVLRLKNGSINSNTRSYEDNTTDILSQIEYVTRKGGSVMFINMEDVDLSAVYKIQGARRSARNGALALMRGNERSGTDKYGDRIDTEYVRYYQNIANENRERYRKLLVQLKAERATMSNTFSTLKTRIDKAFDRYTNILADLIKSPTKYDDYSWDFQSLSREFGDATPKDKWSNRTSGLFYVFREYASYMISVTRGNGSRGSDIQGTMQAYEDRIKHYLDNIERKLTKLENI